MRKLILKYTILFSVLLFTVFSFSSLAFAVNYGGGLYNAGPYSSTPPTTPVASPVAGIYSTAQTVTITATGSTSIRYSTIAIPADCSSGTLYTVPIVVPATETIYVKACDAYNNFSNTSFLYYIIPATSSTGTTQAFRDKFLAEQEAKRLALLETAPDSNVVVPTTPTTPAVTPTVTPTETPAVTTPTLPVTTVAPLNITRILREGMTGNDVKDLQVYLNTHGYTITTTGVGSTGKETTYFGAKTKLAVISFQKANGLTADGVVGPKTVEVMNKGTAPSTTTGSASAPISRTLKQGMTGEDVKTLQTYLNTNGYNCGVADGSFGAKTKLAVISFQKAKGLTPDGVVGPMTFGLLK